MAARSPTPEARRPPNLLLVLVDQMRAMAMGCAGNAQIQTPNLDRLAEEGACCTRAVSNTPVCTPARACLLTGRYPLANTVLTNNSMLPTDLPSLGTMLKNAGYATGYIGKWHLAGEAYIGATRFNQGQNGWIPPGPMRHGWDHWAVHHCSHAYWDACYFRDEPVPIAVDGWEPDVQTDLAIDFLRTHADGQEADKPFALVVAPGTPHTPFVAPREWRALYDPKALELRGNVSIPAEGLVRADSPRPEGTTGAPDDILRRWTAAYYAAVSNIDHNVGRLLAELRTSGVADDTVVVFTSDHGEMLGSQGQLHKVQPWDESIRIPLLLRHPPTVQAGLRVSVPVNLPDVLPTLFGLMDLDVPDGVEGADLSGVLCGDAGEPEQSGFLLWPCSATTWGKQWTETSVGGRGMPAGFMRPYRGIRTRTHTYVRDRRGPWFLYDNEADPLQQRNLAADRNAAAVPPELDHELDAWLGRTRDRFEDTRYYMDLIDLETGACTAPERLTG